MFYNKLSRRHFLQGVGAGLALPFLPSLVPEAHAAGIAELRYIQLLSTYSMYPSYFFPSDTGLVSNGVAMIKPLNTITGNISTVLGSAFDNYKNNISVVRGLNCLAASNLHNGSLPTCASSTPEDNVGNGRPFYPFSIDTVLSQSAKLYPDPTGKQRHVNFAPDNTSDGYSNYSWTKVNGSVQHMPKTDATSALLSKFSMLTTAPPPEDPAVIRKRDVIQAVYADYKAVRDSGKLSTVDKTRFEAYVSLVDEIQKGLAAAPVTNTCSKPSSETEVDPEAIYRNQINILVAAMACNLTRVASMVFTVPYEPMHTWSHQGADAAKHADAQRIMGARMAYLMSKMAQINEGTGTMLDNSVIYWGNEYGEVAGGDPHRTDNMFGVVAGGAAGKLQLGHYIDYRQNRRPFNNFLISLFNAMGLASADYEREGVVGFGEYNQTAINNYGFGGFVSDTERRKPLPFLYKGPILG
ncbi:MAG: DUF1552 domain-containing protein [Bdellovibrionota bacterium]